MGLGLAASAAAELIESALKVIVDLFLVPQTPEEQAEDYGQIGTSAIGLAVMAVLAALAWIVSKLVGAVVEAVRGRKPAPRDHTPGNTPDEHTPGNTPENTTDNTPDNTPQEPTTPLDVVNDTIKQHFERWPERVKQAYIRAQQRLLDSSRLVRRMSEAEYNAIFDEGRGTVNDVFVPGNEGNRVFSLDRLYEFSDNARNTVPGAYDREVLIPMTDELRNFLRANLVPDNVPGGLPSELKGYPRFKLERGDYNIVIPKSIWDDFRRLISDGK